jgi:peptide/nickel transport system permease protein
VRYVKWLGGFATGDLGNYYTVSSNRPVADQFWPAIRTSAILMLWAQVLALAMAIPLAIHSASHEGGWIDKMISNSAYAALSIPGFALTLILAYVLGVKLHWLPPSGCGTPWYDTIGHLRRVIIPAFALSLGPAAIYMRLLRTRPDRHPAPGLHHDGPGQGAVASAHHVAPRPTGVVDHAADRRRPVGGHG